MVSITKEHSLAICHEGPRKDYWVTGMKLDVSVVVTLNYDARTYSLFGFDHRFDHFVQARQGDSHICIIPVVSAGDASSTDVSLIAHVPNALSNLPGY
ncbi:hypothetical protein M514_10989 [Trichuris suis]|uniref:Uncharacterized protein n=1 Tax=Trichuris suis TaxID=68888 RepID=A0A085MWY3_9BILA|nr:hypothetical protein M514_10989 [Trichuris suis]